MPDKPVAKLTIAVAHTHDEHSTVMLVIDPLPDVGKSGLKLTAKNALALADLLVLHALCTDIHNGTDLTGLHDDFGDMLRQANQHVANESEKGTIN